MTRHKRPPPALVLLDWFFSRGAYFASGFVVGLFLGALHGCIPAVDCALPPGRADLVIQIDYRETTVWRGTAQMKGHGYEEARERLAGCWGLTGLEGQAEALTVCVLPVGEAPGADGGLGD